MTTELNITVDDITFFAGDLNVQRAAATFKEHGCLVVRGLMKPYIKEIHRDIEAAATESIALLERAEKIVEGWRTPNGTLFLPAPPGYKRDKQIMVLAINHYTSAAFFRSALDKQALDIVRPNVKDLKRAPVTVLGFKWCQILIIERGIDVLNIQVTNVVALFHFIGSQVGKGVTD